MDLEPPQLGTRLGARRAVIARSALRRTPWRRVWGDARRTGAVTHFSPWVRALRGCACVYLIRDFEDYSVMYVGQARDLYERMRRHFYVHKGRDPPIPHERTEARVYVLPASCLLAAEDRRILLYPNALNKARLDGASPF